MHTRYTLGERAKESAPRRPELSRSHGSSSGSGGDIPTYLPTYRAGYTSSLRVASAPLRISFSSSFFLPRTHTFFFFFFSSLSSYSLSILSLLSPTPTHIHIYTHTHFTNSNPVERNRRGKRRVRTTRADATDETI